MNNPNILLITDDQHRWDFFEGGHVPSLRTPAFQRLKSRGVTLTNAYSNCPICMPTRFTWMTGLYASQGGERLLVNNLDWPTHVKTFPQALQKAGYKTALVGKLHSLAGLYHRDVTEKVEETRGRGFDDALEVCGKSLAYWFDCKWTRHLDNKGLLGTYRKDLEGRIKQLGGKEHAGSSVLPTEDTMDSFIGRNARKWLEDYTKTKPFFLHASFCGPHFPYDPPEKFARRFRPEDMPPPQGVDDPVDIRYWQEIRAGYCAMIAHLDNEIGMLLDTLEKRGLSENTLVIYCTDHGDMMGHHGQGHKGTAYDTSARTPVIYHFPGVLGKDKILLDPVEAVDLPCTILDAAGLGDKIQELLPNTPGKSCWPYLKGETDAHRKWAYSECGMFGGWRMCRSHEYKYVFHPSEGHKLFDMAVDPFELFNLADNPEYSKKMSEMQDMLIQSMMLAVAPNTDGGPLPRDDWWKMISKKDDT